MDTRALSLPHHLHSAALGLGYTIEGDGERYQLVSIDTGQQFEQHGRDTFTTDELEDTLHALWRAQR